VENRKGFTLIELLVVIAIIALLLAIIVPSLKLTKQKAASIICATNTKNLALGWFSYKEDNGGRIMGSCMGGGRSRIKPPQGPIDIPGWIKTPYNTTPGDRTINGITPVVTDEDEIRGIEDGALNPYLKSPKSFTCPADKVKSIYDGTEKFVTLAIPDALAGIHGQSDAAVDGRILKFDEITSPSSKYNFVETAEERNWIMSGHFVLGTPENGKSVFGWWSPMAVNHGDSSILGFCDGHSEIHKWQDAYTKERVKKLSALGTGDYGYDDPRLQPGSPVTDIEYMAKGWPYRYK
jgi:prepilin-type N-terminal cleavage/methylation domain-containing protein